ncbi:MAG: hypothetical protein ABI446_05885 [Gemmatimonadaceae bacterium]
MHAIDIATATVRIASIARRAFADQSSSERFPTAEVRLIMYSVVSRTARWIFLALIPVLAAGCHHHAANPTALVPESGIESGAEAAAPLLNRGDKVLVVIDGEKRGSGSFNGERVVLDPPLDTISPARIDSARVRVGPATREMYGVSYRMVGVLLVWMKPN